MKGKTHVHAVFVALAALCALLAGIGALDRLEGQAHDLAVSTGLYAYEPKPEHRIVVVAIDDRALDFMQVARRQTWPWTRDLHGDVLDELTVLGARTVAYDIAFTEPRVQAQGNLFETDEAPYDGPAGDDGFREAIERHGGVILAARLAGERAGVGSVDGNVWRALRAIEGQPFESGVGEHRSAAMAAVGAVLDFDMESGIGVARAQRALDRALVYRAACASPATPDAPLGVALPLVDHAPGLPARSVASGAWGLGNTDMGRSAGDVDGVVRRVPLWVSDGATVHPMLGLAAAMHYAGASAEGIDATRTRFGGVLPDVPTDEGRLRGFAGTASGIARVRWSGNGTWMEQYASGGAGSIVSVLELTNARSRRLAIERRLDVIDETMDFVAEPAGLAGEMAAYRERAGALRPVRPLSEAWSAEYEAQRVVWRAAREFFDEAGAAPDEGLGDLEFYAAAFDAAWGEAGALEGAVDEYRTASVSLEAIDDALVFVGSVATKRANDMVPTSIDPETPGVFVHAAVAQSLLSGRVLAPTPGAVPALAAFLFGLVGLSLARRTAQWVGLALCIVISAVWLLLGTWLVDLRLGQGSVIAGAIFALVFCWLARSAYRAITEARARRRTEERFKAYVSPDVVDILVNNPELGSMEPMRKELTMMFSDIAGFTTIAERLGTQRTTEALGAYLREMTDALQVTGATLDKYLGDGIMAFWGAPIDQPDHAVNAARCAVDMLERLDALNEQGVFGEMGPIAIRIGLATGTVSVGDFGNPPHRSAYTVIGDSVNLSARLEGANKQIGTSILMNARCAELVGGAVPTRPVGSILVVGKRTPEPLRAVYRPGERPEAFEREWLTLCDEATGHFAARRWPEARVAYERLRSEFADEKIAIRHLEAIEMLEQDPEAPCAIELTEK